MLDSEGGVAAELLQRVHALVLDDEQHLDVCVHGKLVRFLDQISFALVLPTLLLNVFAAAACLLYWPSAKHFQICY